MLIIPVCLCIRKHVQLLKLRNFLKNYIIEKEYLKKKSVKGQIANICGFGDRTTSRT